MKYTINPFPAIQEFYFIWACQPFLSCVLDQSYFVCSHLMEVPYEIQATLAERLTLTLGSYLFLSSHYCKMGNFSVERESAIDHSFEVW